MKRYALFAFRGDPICFIHVMLNALDLKSKGHAVKVIMEGDAVRLVEILQKEENKLLARLQEEDLVDCICRACSAKLGVLEYNQGCGIRLSDEMNGHPAMSTYLDQGYEIITF
jgi:hypothetical protein